MPISSQDIAVSKKSNDSRTKNLQEQIVNSLRIQLGNNVLEMWFENGQSILVLADRIRVNGASEFHLNRIRTRFGTELKQAVEQACGKDVRLDFKLTDIDAGTCLQAASEVCVKPLGGSRPTDIFKNRTSSLTAKSASNSIVPQAESESGNRPLRAKGIDTFWFGDGNRLVRAGVDQMFEQVGQMSPFVIYGPSGCGKSHLLESIVHDARRKHNLKRCVYLSAEQFTSNFVQALRGTGLPVFRRKYRDLDLLAIDDVHFFGGKNATLAEFQHTVDSLTRNGKQVVLSSDRPPIDLGKLGTEITARMLSGLVCPLNYPDAAGRNKIVKEICRTRGFELTSDVIELIGKNLARDVRRLSGAVNRLRALSIAMDEPITVEIARKALTDLFSISATITSIGAIEKSVCEFCGVKPADLKSSCRQKKISSARMLAMYLSRQYTPNACSEIGDYFGGRSHSTVIAAQKKVSSWLASNQAIDLPHAKYPAKDAIVRIESNLRIG